MIKISVKIKYHTHLGIERVLEVYGLRTKIGDSSSSSSAACGIMENS
jgi:hypothetical protein